MTGDTSGAAGRLHGLLDRFLRPIEFAAFLIAAAFLLVSAVLISCDALLRYLFDAPLAFQYTLTESYLLIGLVAMALPFGFRTGGYIRIRGLAALLPDTLSVLLLRAGLLLSAAYIGAMTWKTGAHFIATYVAGDIKTGLIDWPVWPSWIWIPTGLGLLTARLLLTALGPAESLHVEHEPTEEI